MATAWIRLALARGFAREAESLAKRWHSFAVLRSCVRTEIRMGILVAAARLASQDLTGATRALNEALAHALPRGLILPFAEEGEAVMQAVTAIFGISGGRGSGVAFTAELRRAYEANPERVLMRARPAPLPARETIAVDGRLSQREIDILEFVSRGLQNKEIGELLGLTEGSVKWYMQQIYAKLGVRRRLKAFQKAKALGLIR
jgi:LuxR family maltose regulon positive regulatory protein